jgi:hypothetical protein
MLRWWMVGVMLVAGCEADARTCGQGGLGVRLVNKALIVGVFVHRVEDVETLEGDYELPPPSAEWVRVEAEVDENFWWGRRPDGALAMFVSSHVALVDDVCGPRFDDSEPWSERPYVRLDPSLVGAPLAIVDPTLAHVEPTFELAESLDDDWAYPLAGDDDRLGFTLRARYYVEPAGCDDPSCSSIVRLTHHFRRP